jgi:hypothetical protein
MLLISILYRGAHVSLSFCVCVTFISLIVFQVFANSMTLALQSVFRNLQVCIYLCVCAVALCELHTVVVCGVMRFDVVRCGLVQYGEVWYGVMLYSAV